MEETEEAGRAGGARVDRAGTGSRRRSFPGAEEHEVDLAAQNEELRAARQQADAHLERYSDLYDFAPVGYLSLDARGTILQANLAAAALLGVPRNVLGGRRLRAFLDVASQDALDSFLARVFRREGKEVGEVSLHVEGIGSLFLHVEGAVSRREGECVVAVVDVTARKKAESEVRLLNTRLEQRVSERTAELEAANRELVAFTYSASHDMRAPLRAIDGYAKLLSEKVVRRTGALDEEERRLFRTIGRNVARLERLIDDLLRLSRSGRSEMRVESVDMNALVREVLDGLLPGGERGRVDVRLEPLPRARGDAGLVEVVLENLLSNALKFSSTRERPVVEVGSRPAEEGGVEYFVRDNGVGFEPRYTERLFVLFHRLHPTSAFEGAGIGLALVRRIVERHGGRVRAEGEPDRGATFSFTLAPAPEAAPG